MDPGSHPLTRQAGTHARSEPERIEAEVGQLREELGGLVGELNRRRRRLFDWSAQLRDHRTQLAVLGAFGLLSGLAWSARQRHQRRLHGSWLRAQNLARTLVAFSENPDRPPAERRPGRWLVPVAGALGSAGLAVARAAAMQAVKSRIRR